MTEVCLLYMVVMHAYIVSLLRLYYSVSVLCLFNKAAHLTNTVEFIVYASFVRFLTGQSFILNVQFLICR